MTKKNLLKSVSNSTIIFLESRDQPISLDRISSKFSVPHLYMKSIAYQTKTKQKTFFSTTDKSAAV